MTKKNDKGAGRGFGRLPDNRLSRRTCASLLVGPGVHPAIAIPVLRGRTR